MSKEINHFTTDNNQEAINLNNNFAGLSGPTAQPRPQPQPQFDLINPQILASVSPLMTGVGMGMGLGYNSNNYNNNNNIDTASNGESGNLNLYLTLSLILSILYTALCLTSAIQLIRIIIYRHNIKSFHCAFLSLAFIWTLLRVIWLNESFPFNYSTNNNNNNINNNNSYWGSWGLVLNVILYWLPVNIQFSTFSLLLVFYLYLLYKHEWIYKRVYIIGLYIATNFTIYTLTFFYIYLQCKDGCHSTPSLERALHTFQALVFLVLVIVYAFYGYKLSISHISSLAPVGLPTPSSLHNIRHHFRTRGRFYGSMNPIKTSNLSQMNANNKNSNLINPQSPGAGGTVNYSGLRGLSGQVDEPKSKINLTGSSPIKSAPLTSSPINKAFDQSNNLHNNNGSSNNLNKLRSVRNSLDYNNNEINTLSPDPGPGPNSSNSICSLLLSYTCFSLPFPPLSSLTALTMIAWLVFSSRCLYNFIAGFASMDIDLGGDNGGVKHISVIPFLLLLWWEILPTFLVIICFRKIPKTNNHYLCCCFNKTNSSSPSSDVLYLNKNSPGNPTPTNSKEKNYSDPLTPTNAESFADNPLVNSFHQPNPNFQNAGGGGGGIDDLDEEIFSAYYSPHTITRSINRININTNSNANTPNSINVNQPNINNLYAGESNINSFSQNNKTNSINRLDSMESIGSNPFRNGNSKEKGRYVSSQDKSNYLENENREELLKDPKLPIVAPPAPSYRSTFFDGLDKRDIYVDEYYYAYQSAFTHFPNNNLININVNDVNSSNLNVNNPYYLESNHNNAYLNSNMNTSRIVKSENQNHINPRVLQGQSINDDNDVNINHFNNHPNSNNPKHIIHDNENSLNNINSNTPLLRKS